MKKKHTNQKELVTGKETAVEARTETGAVMDGGGEPGKKSFTE